MFTPYLCKNLWFIKQLKHITNWVSATYKFKIQHEYLFIHNHKHPVLSLFL